jgi:hypothetical protein
MFGRAAMSEFDGPTQAAGFERCSFPSRTAHLPSCASPPVGLLVVPLASERMDEAGGVGKEFVTAGRGAEPPSRCRWGVLAGVGHAADQVGGHGGQLAEAAVLQPQDPVGDLLKSGVMADDHHGAVVLGGEPAE